MSGLINSFGLFGWHWIHLLDTKLLIFDWQGKAPEEEAKEKEIEKPKEKVMEKGKKTETEKEQKQKKLEKKKPEKEEKPKKQ